MVGKASLFVIMGFSVLFLVVIQNFGGITNRAVDNFVEYHQETLAHNIAVSAANMAASEVYYNPTWSAGYPSTPFQGGSFTVDVDYDPVYNTHEITSTGTYQGKTSTVKIELAPSTFSRFAYFSIWEKESPTGDPIWWIGKDTVWGPFHTEDHLRVNDHPAFLGNSLSHKGSLILYDYYTYYPSQIPQKPTNSTQRNRYNASWEADKPTIAGDYKPGFSMTIPTGSADNIEAAADENGLKFTNQDTVYLTFANDSLSFRFSYNTTDSVVHLPTVSPNGVIFAKNSVVRLKGTVKGQYTVVCSTPGSGAGANKQKGIIYLDDDIVYNKDPRDYPESTDLLGIVAENNVWITENASNNNNINIHGSIFCEKEGFGAVNYKNRPVSGSINLLGGIIQEWRKPVGTFSGSVIKSGFTKQYMYDNRLLLMSPPFFPGTGGFRIVSWLE
jgi:hypothetical protein